MQTHDPPTPVYLTLAEERRLSRLAMGGPAIPEAVRDEARSRLVLNIRRLIYKRALWVANRCGYPDAEELAGEGMLRVLERFRRGMCRYRPGRARVSTYWIKAATGAMIAWAHKHRRAITVPYDIPSDEKNAPRAASAAVAHRTISLDTLMECSGRFDSDNPMEPVDPNCLGPDDDMDERDRRIRLFIAMCRLRRADLRLARVVVMRLNNRKLAWIGAKLGVTRERARQLWEVAVRRLIAMIHEQGQGQE